MKKLLWIILLGIVACEEQVEVPLPAPENLLVIEGFVTDSLQIQTIEISRTLPFGSKVLSNPISSAEVSVSSDAGDTFTFSHSEQGKYLSDLAFKGNAGTAYKLIINQDGQTIESSWDKMPLPIAAFELEVSSFLENDPDSDDQITVYYPKVTAQDPASISNHYRWILYKNGVVFNDPEPISIQDDRFFDGNLIPNNFQNFNYASGDTIEIELQGITKQTYEFLNLLRSQITTLGRSSGTTPSAVRGNLQFINSQEIVLGYFGTAAIRSNSLPVPSN